MKSVQQCVLIDPIPHKRLGFITSGLIGSKDSLAGSDDPLSNITELLLLLRSEEGVCVRHPDSGGTMEKLGA